MPAHSVQRDLVVGPSWVGDMVMAQVLFKLLRRQNPDLQLDVLAPAWSRPITARMPEVARSLDMPVGHGKIMLGERYRLGRALSRQGYQRAFVLPGSLKSALVPAFAGIPTRIGWRGEMRYGLIDDIRKLDKKRYPLMIERFAALAFEPGTALPDPLPAPELVSDPAEGERLRDEYELSSDRPVLALCPGAEFGPSKRWPEEHYAALASAKIAQGWQVWLFGSAKDEPVAQRIVDAVPDAERAHVTSLAGRTSLAEAIDLLACADAVVSNDSGLMHIASALNRPLVALYGSSSPSFTPPLGDRVATVKLDLDCQPCFKRECPLGHKRCLTELSVEHVLRALDPLAS